MCHQVLHLNSAFMPGSRSAQNQDSAHCFQDKGPVSPLSQVELTQSRLGTGWWYLCVPFGEMLHLSLLLSSSCENAKIRPSN